MKRIIIPTDFSDISRNAIHYGFCMAQELNMQVTLIHVLELYKFAAGTSETEILSTILPPENIREMEQTAERNFKKLIEEITRESGSPAQYDFKVITGQLVNEVLAEAETNETSLIIMGVASSQDLFTRFTEGTVSAVIKDAHCPVLIVPSQKRYNSIHKVVFATDFKKAELDAFHHVFHLLENAKPQFKLLHFTTKQPVEFTTDLKMAGFRQLLAEKYKIDAVDSNINSHKSIVKGILESLSKEEVDLLVMIKGHESFFKSLFDTSRAEKITHYLKIPMLSYNENFKPE